MHPPTKKRKPRQRKTKEISWKVPRVRKEDSYISCQYNRMVFFPLYIFSDSCFFLFCIFLSLSLSLSLPPFTHFPSPLFPLFVFYFFIPRLSIDKRFIGILSSNVYCRNTGHRVVNNSPIEKIGLSRYSGRRVLIIKTSDASITRC